MAAMSETTCETCRFSRDELDSCQMLCLRYPPQNFVEDDGAINSFPTITERNSWCGEHQPREGDA